MCTQKEHIPLQSQCIDVHVHVKKKKKKALHQLYVRYWWIWHKLTDSNYIRKYLNKDSPGKMALTHFETIC